MAKQSFKDQLSSWKVNSENRREVVRLDEAWDFLGEKLFAEYEPGLAPTFSARDFFSRDDMAALQISALRTQVVPWLVQQKGIDLMSGSFEEEVRRALEETCFCPLTDSMRINAFFHVNGLQEQKLRPDFVSLSQLGDIQKIKQHFAATNTSRLVLLEDFVGSGRQTGAAIEFAATQLGMPVLVVPLVICPTGHGEFVKLASKHAALTYAPVVALDRELFLSDTARTQEPTFFRRLRGIVESTRDRVCYDAADSQYGYDKTGGLVVLFSNTPNNSLLILHRTKWPSWRALFPRAGR